MTKSHSETPGAFPLARRRFLQGAAATGLAAASMPITKAVWSQSGSRLVAHKKCSM